LEKEGKQSQTTHFFRKAKVSEYASIRKERQTVSYIMYFFRKKERQTVSNYASFGKERQTASDHTTFGKEWQTISDHTSGNVRQTVADHLLKAQTNSLRAFIYSIMKGKANSLRSSF